MFNFISYVYQEDLKQEEEALVRKIVEENLDIR